MSISAFDLFKIGIGPSSSHTVGPMKAARLFALHLQQESTVYGSVARVKAELFGSLGLTGKGHGSPKAVLLGLEGETPEHINVDEIASRVAKIEESSELALMGEKLIAFERSTDLILHKRKSLPFHSNGMQFTAFDSQGVEITRKTFYSVGGGFIVDETASENDAIVDDPTELPYPFASGDELLVMCADSGLSISALMMENEKAWRSEKEIRELSLKLWRVMEACIKKGCATEGIMPGGLKVKRRASQMFRQLKSQTDSFGDKSLNTMDWVTLYALAVNEENASGGRIVTAPTNGAAGIIPAVLKYYLDHCQGAGEEDVCRYFLTAAAIGILYKMNASISGAEVGCQGEVGSACSMAAGALTEALGGTPGQVENAAEIAMEHNLGLTCDPVGGLVQVPCIERNAMGAIKAISAARLALYGDGTHFVSLDKVIRTMRDTGRDMKQKYKETARGGLALNVLEVPVNIVEC
jgi:L-serine dehydratase